MEPQRIAVVRLDKIGDLVLTTPAIASLKATYPHASLTAIVSGRNKGVLENSPDVDEIWEWRWNRENVAKLKAAKFDAVVVFSPTTTSYKLARESRAPVRAGYVYASRVLTRGFSRLWLNRRLVCRVDQKDLEKKPQAVPHEVEQNLALVRLVAGTKAVMKENLVVVVSEAEIAQARDRLGGGEWIAVHLSKAWFNSLPPNFFSHLLKELSKQKKLFVTWGPEEVSLASSIAFPEGVKFFGSLSFPRWAALLARATVCLSPNTGAVHVAASQKTPVVAVFEPKFFAYHAQRWSPWQVPHAILRKDDPALLAKILEETGRLSHVQENHGSNLQP